METEDEIREQMEDTRTSLTDKLETLEKQVANSVSDATTNVTDTVEAVKESVQETVSSVKDSVQETISAVKESMHQGVTAVKDFFDIPSHVDHHPWAMMGGSVALGYVVGSLAMRATRRGSKRPVFINSSLRVAAMRMAGARVQVRRRRRDG